MEWIIVLLLKYKYLIMLGLMFAEGPAVSFICAFLAAQGFFSFWIVYILSIFGDLIGDVFRYLLGRFARRFGAKRFLTMQNKGQIIDKKLLKRPARISLRVAERMNKMEGKPIFKYIHQQMKKRLLFALFLIKITPPLSIPGQISLWFFKIPFPKFFLQTTILIILLESIFLNLGYFSSMSINVFRDRLDTIWFVISVVVIGGLALWAGFLIVKKMRSSSKFR